MQAEQSVLYLLLEENKENKEKVLEYCEKKLSPLEEIDRLRGTDYVHTLEVYLENGNDLLHSAQKMYIHRNTMINRMKKITSILGEDINDPKVRAEYNNIYFTINYFNK